PFPTRRSSDLRSPSFSRSSSSTKITMRPARSSATISGIDEMGLGPEAAESGEANADMTVVRRWIKNLTVAACRTAATGKPGILPGWDGKPAGPSAGASIRCALRVGSLRRAIQPGPQLGIQRFASVENEATTPEFFAADLLEVFEDPAVELVNAFDARFGHVDRRLFAANAPCAEAHDGLALQLRAMRLHRLGKLRKARNPPIDGPFERTFVDLEGIARIEHHDFIARVVPPLPQPSRQRARVDGRRPAGFRPDRRVIHANDFAFDLDQQLAERHMLG